MQLKDKHTKKEAKFGTGQMLPQVPCYIFSISEIKGIQQVNTYASNALGYTKKELIGKKKFEALLTPGSKILFQTHFLPLLNLKGNAEEIILSLKTKKGAEIPMVFNISVVEENSIKIFYVAGIPIAKRNEYEKGLLETIRNSAKIFSENEALNDLSKSLETNQLILEKKLRETNRLNDEHNQLNKVLSHDLQEPLRKILFYANALPDPKAKPNRNRSKILDAALSMRTIANSLQRFYALDYELKTDDRSDLLSLIQEAEAESNAKEINCDRSGLKDGDFKGNPAHFKGLFIELFDNAYKFKQISKPLEIAIESQTVQQNIYRATDGKYRYEDFLRIKFSDNGIGFSDHHAPKIFQLFQKLHPNDGLGIGLSYCKKIIELYNGTITVQSKVNVGTTFTIMLPNFE